MKNLTSLLAIASFTVCGVTIAHADPAFEPRSVTVSFEDLNTASVQGAAVLFGRVKHASENVCQDLDSRRDLALMQLHTQCVHRALGDAIAMINRPAVSAYAAAHGVVLGDTAIKVASNR
jgi:UrcA family protein